MSDEPMTRAELARRRVELAESAARAEAQAARKLIARFVEDAAAAGVKPHPLRARLLGGAEVSTDKTGWYLRVNHSIAIGSDGHYYVLVVPGGWRERLFGAKLVASDPPLFIGKGGRDGETGDLQFFLDRALRGEVG